MKHAIGLFILTFMFTWVALVLISDNDDDGVDVRIFLSAIIALGVALL